jgi:PilZ domain-containing protein
MSKVIRRVPKKVNKRVSPRRRGVSRVECRLGAVGQGVNCAESLVDVSELGARVILTQAIDPGRRVELRLLGWGHKSPVTRTAGVIWCTPTEEEGRFLVGVQFEQYLSYDELCLMT